MNAMLFLTYLFVAVFIMLSMFLAILGENQAAVRSDQDASRDKGEAPPEYGIFHNAGGMLKSGFAKLVRRARQASSSGEDANGSRR